MGLGRGLMSRFRVAVRFGRMLVGGRMIALCVMLGGSAMRLGRCLVRLSSLGMARIWHVASLFFIAGMIRFNRNTSLER